MRNFWVFKDGFIADGSFIDQISNSWEVGKIINIAYKPHNRTLLRSNIKMDHWYRQPDLRRIGSDYATVLFGLVTPVDHITDPPK